MIADIVLMSNGQLLAFDEGGKQLPEYQGRLDAVLEKALADAPPAARFFVGDWHNGWVETTRQCIECWLGVLAGKGCGAQR
jgi:hypothetical protein